MSNATLRHKRLLSLLPGIYATQPEQSHIAALLRALAEMLGGYDDAMRRVLYDRWLVLATGKRSDAATASALGHLGSLLSIYRLPPRIEHNDEQGLFGGHNDKLEIPFKSAQQRRDALYDLIGLASDDQLTERLQALFPDLRFTVDSDSSLLVEKRQPEPEGVKGLPAGQDEAEEDADALRIFRSMLEWESSELYRQRLHITAGILIRGLVTRRAILSLAIADVGAWPCARIRQNEVSAAAQELGIPADTSWAYGVDPAQARSCAACHVPKLPCPFAGEAKKQIIEARLVENPVMQVEKVFPEKGEALLVTGETATGVMLECESDSLWPDRPVLHLVLRSEVTNKTELRISPASSDKDDALVITLPAKTPEGTVIDVYPRLTEQELVPFASGERVSHHTWDTAQGYSTVTPAAPESGARPNNTASGSQSITTPRLFSGPNRWYVKATEGDQPVSLSFTLRLRWFIRRPFHFRLVMPKTAALKQAEMRGALQLLKRDLERIRAAGVRADLVFPDTPRREEHVLADALQSVGFTSREDMNLQEVEKPFPFYLTALCSYEEHTPEEGTLWITAILGDEDGVGGTRFDESLFADEPSKEGRLGQAKFGKAKFA